MNPALNFLYHKLINKPDRWHPFLSVYYLTYRCNFRCPYCSNGFGKPYYNLPDGFSKAETVLEILKRIRQKCDHLVITGGEPLLHPEFLQIISRLNEIGFKHVALNTNGYEVDRCLPEVAESIDSLIFSLDTLNEEKADAWFGNGTGVLRKILSNIELTARNSKKKYRIVISSVITPHNIQDIFEVYKYTKQHGFTLAVCPELQGVKPPNELLNNNEYESLYDYLIAEKKRGGRIFGSTAYLNHMRNFTRFKCRPFTMLVVDPSGDIFYPCLEIGHIAGNILKEDNLHKLREKSLKRFGPQPDCGTQCHSACALGFSLFLNNPFTVLKDVPGDIKALLNQKINL